MFSPGDQPISGYRLIHFLGKGQFGEVWKASGPGGTEVALKFIHLNQRTGIRELKSIQAVKLIRHANLLPVHAIWLLGMDGKVLDDALLDQLLSDSPPPQGTMALDVTQTLENPQYLVVSMALADKSLEDLLKDSAGEGIPQPVLLDLMRQAAKGIDFLNSPRHLVQGQKVGIQHRDIKPANLLISGDSLLIGDFGVAAAFGEYDTEATSVVGSLCYMSPESIKRTPSHTSDQYALAITYYQLRANALPFEKTVSFAELVEIHIGGKLDFGRATPHEQAALRRATSTDPKKRYPTCAEFVADLGGAPTNAAEKPKRRTAMVAALLLVSLLALAGAYLTQGSLWHLGGTPDPIGKDGTDPPIHQLTFQPPGTEFVIQILGIDQEVIDRLTGQDQAAIDLREGQRISIEAGLPDSLYLPLQEEFSVEDLQARAWQLTLPRMDAAAIREKAADALQNGDLTAATRLYRLALQAMSEELLPLPILEADLEATPAVVDDGRGTLETLMSAGSQRPRFHRLVAPVDQATSWEVPHHRLDGLPVAYHWLAAASVVIEIHDREVGLLDLASGERQQTLDLGLPKPEIPYRQITSHAVSSDQKWLLLGQDDGRVRLAEISAPDARLALAAEFALPQRVVAIVPLADKALVVDQSGNAAVVRLPADAGDSAAISAFEDSSIHTLDLQGESIHRAIPLDGDRVCLVTDARAYRVDLSATDSEPHLMPLLELRGDPRHVQYLGNDRIAISTDLPNRALGLISTTGGEADWIRNPQVNGMVEDFAVSPDRRWLLVADTSGELSGFDLQADPPSRVTLRPSDRQRIKFIGFHAEPQYLVLAFESGQLQCWDFASLLLTGLARQDAQ